MKSLYRYIRILISNLRKIWIIEIYYPKIYPNGNLKSIVHPNLIDHSIGLFIEENVIIKDSKIKIGNHTYIGNNTSIDSCSRIGAYCSISSDVKIGMRNHPLDYISTSPVFYSKYRPWLQESRFDEKELKRVIIEDDVLISANVIIINGVLIGRGAVIGAGSVVTKDVPPYSIVAGVPAKVIRYRFSKEIIKRIEASGWWAREEELLKKNLEYSNNPELFLSKLNNI